jgi:hypothetical protein
MTTKKKLKSLKITHELHHELDKLRAELSAGMGKMVSAILSDAIKNGPKAVWKIMQQVEKDPGHTRPEEPPRTAKQSQSASATAKRRNAR